MNKLLLIGLFLALFSSCTKPPGPDIAWWIKCDATLNAPQDRIGSVDDKGHLTTPPIAEFYGCLPVPTGFAQIALQRVLYSVRLTNVHQGDIMQYTAQSEMTNDTYTDNPMVGRFVELASSSINVLGTRISPAQASNLTPQEHHGIVAMSGYYEFVSDYDEVYLNFVVYGAGAQMLDERLVIEQGYGGIQGILTRSYK